MRNKLSTYFKVWKIIASNALQETFVNRGTNLFFLFGKAIRLAMSLSVLLLIKQNIKVFAGYTADEMIVFFLVYQFIDTLGQVFFRGVYMFSNQIRTGEFDFLLAKPISPLFRALTGHPDINDAIFIFPATAINLYIASHLQLDISPYSMILFGVLLINSFLIVTALHIWVLILGILTTEVDGIVWLYRDLSRLGQFPIKIYMQPLRFALTFLVPIAAMMTVPAEILVQSQPMLSISLTFGVGIIFLLVTLKAWNWGLKNYSSASS